MRAKLDDQGRKRCTRCQGYKPLDKEHFYFNNYGGYFYSWCRLCHNKRSIESARRQRADKKGIAFKPKFDDQGRKLCARCEEYKPLDSEHFSFNEKGQRWSSWCRPCSVDAAEESRLRNQATKLGVGMSDAKIIRMYWRSLITTPQLYFHMKKRHGEMAVSIMNLERERFGLPPIDRLEVRRWDRFKDS